MIRGRHTILVMLMSIAACTSTAPGVEIGRSDAFDTDSPDIGEPEPEPEPEAPGAGEAEEPLPPMMEVPTSTIPFDGPFPLDPDKPPQPFDGLMLATIEDLELYWAETMPQVFGSEYESLIGGVFPAYPQRTDYPEGCFSTYEEIENNGFYCPGPYDYIAWDDVGYARGGWDNHGSGAITALMSHEWGHAVQGRTGVFDIVPELSTPIIELQADCYSGAWFGRIARGESDVLTFTDADIRSGIIDTVLSADPVGYSPDDPGAHGAGFDRVSSFQDGFNNGAGQCATYAETPPTITEFGFTDADLMQDVPGDISAEEVVEVIPDDLNKFWSGILPDQFTALDVQPFGEEVPACDGLAAADIAASIAIYCPATGSVLVNESNGRAVVREFGDFSFAYFLAAAWGEAAQVAVDSTLTGEQRVLFSDCLVGAWAMDISPMGGSQRDVEISPGDLDEAIATALLVADDTADEDVLGDAFAKIDAFRTGVLGSLNGCNEYFS